MLRQLEELLGTRGATYERIAHPEAFTSQEEAAAADVSGWSWAKVVIVKEREGLAMAVLPACCTIDMDRLKGVIGLGEVELASVEEVLAHFPGCELGAMPPFGRLFGVPTFVEEALVDQRDVTMPAGDRRSAIRMRATEYLRVAEPRLGQFAVHVDTFPVHPKPRTRTARARAGGRERRAGVTASRPERGGVTSSPGA
jgi:Ala-tRNA(Pro) deacylase